MLVVEIVVFDRGDCYVVRAEGNGIYSDCAYKKENYDAEASIAAVAKFFELRAELCGG